MVKGLKVLLYISNTKCHMCAYTCSATDVAFADSSFGIPKVNSELLCNCMLLT